MEIMKLNDINDVFAQNQHFKGLEFVDKILETIGVSIEFDDDDLKQMYVYNMYWESERSILLYPTSIEIITEFGKFHKGRQNENRFKGVTALQRTLLRGDCQRIARYQGGRHLGLQNPAG